MQVLPFCSKARVWVSFPVKHKVYGDKEAKVKYFYQGWEVLLNPSLSVCGDKNHIILFLKKHPTVDF